jgi:serine/threonine protein kinase
MELLEGETLAARIERGPVPLAEAMRIALGLLAALQVLHPKELVHRDLKPSNMFLTENGVKIIDFGLARLSRVDPTVTQTLLTSPGLLVGTPSYMSPEQLLGHAITPASDLFAAGAIIFEMLSSRRAFTGRSVVEIFHTIQYGQPPTLTGSPAIAAVDRVIHRALEKEPHECYPSSPGHGAGIAGGALTRGFQRHPVRPRNEPLDRAAVSCSSARPEDRLSRL